MNSKFLMTFSSLAVLGLSSISIAQDAPAPVTPEAPSQQREAVVEKREKIQEKRIDQGVKNGTLTEKEAGRLEKQEGRIENAEKNAMKDGKMSKGEFRKIEKAQNRESRRIYRKKHN